MPHSPLSLISQLLLSVDTILDKQLSKLLEDDGCLSSDQVNGITTVFDSYCCGTSRETCDRGNERQSMQASDCKHRPVNKKCFA